MSKWNHNKRRRTSQKSKRQKVICPCASAYLKRRNETLEVDVFERRFSTMKKSIKSILKKASHVAKQQVERQGYHVEKMKFTMTTVVKKKRDRKH